VSCEGAIGEPGGDDIVTPGSTLVSESVSRRLSRAELDRTLLDLLGDDTKPASMRLEEDVFTPYDTDWSTQHASQALIESFEVVAEDVAARFVADPARRAMLVPCTPASAGDEACFRQFVESFGRRAFRRALTPDEIDAYLPLLSFATEDNAYVAHDFYTAVALVVRAVLQDPEFLYLIEVGRPTLTPEVYALTDNELASRMAYLLWGTIPDDALLAEAQAGRLTDPVSRRAAAERMLGDARARSQMRRFHSLWLGYRAIPNDPMLIAAFERETGALVDRAVFDSGSYVETLFRSPETYLDTFLAGHYGLTAPAGGEGWAPYGDSGRSGILSHGSVLAAFSKFNDTSPTQRGIFVRTRLLCESVPPPPPTVMVDQPPTGDGTSACKLDRYTLHRESSSSCSGCHSQMDPIGFGLEQYDIAGRFRTHDDGHPECPIDGAGELPPYGTFSGPAELATKLIDSGQLEPCIVQQYLAFAIGRAPLSATDIEEQIRTDLVGKLQASGGSFEELVLSYIESDAFAHRREPAAAP